MAKTVNHEKEKLAPHCIDWYNDDCSSQGAALYSSHFKAEQNSLPLPHLAPECDRFKVSDRTAASIATAL